jgi:gamma-glutamylcysteine synthetase
MSDKPEEKKETPKVYPVSPPVNVPDEPVMTMSQFQQGAQMMHRFLKGIDIKVKGNKVQTIYNWEFPDELVAKTFAESLKEQFEGAMEAKK